MPQLRTPHSALRTRRGSSALRLWARLRPIAPGEIPPPAQPTPQPAPGAPAINVHTGTPILPSAQARPSASPTLILPLLLCTLTLAHFAGFNLQPSTFNFQPAMPKLRTLHSALRTRGPSALAASCSSLPPQRNAFCDFSYLFVATPPAYPATHTSRPIQALTGNPTTECRDRSDLRLDRLARLSTRVPFVPCLPCLLVVPFPISRLPHLSAVASEKADHASRLTHPVSAFSI